MEEQKSYDKTITFSKLAEYIFGTYCMPKIMRDADIKPDPLTETFHDLRTMFIDESVEKNHARFVWEELKTDSSANAYLEEIADQINILLFEAGKVAGYTEMERK